MSDEEYPCDPGYCQIVELYASIKALTAERNEAIRRRDAWNAAIEAAAKALIPKRLKSAPSEYEKGYNDGLGDAFNAVLALLKGGAA
jgi:hypothetical protein